MKKKTSKKSALPKRLAGFRVPPSHVVLIVVPFAWGKGETVEEAAEQVRLAGGYMHLARGAIRIFLSRDPECGVDEMGGLRWHPAEGARKLGVRRELDDANYPFLIFEQEG